VLGYSAPSVGRALITPPDLNALRAFIDSLGPFGEVRVSHHTVPVAHLKVFTDTGRESGCVWMYNRAAPHAPKHVAPRVIAKQKRLYTIEHEKALAELPEDFFERILATHIEGPFTLIRNKLVFGPNVGILPVLTPREELDLAMFLVAQQLRTPAFRRRIEWMGAVHATFDVRARLDAVTRGGAAWPSMKNLAPREAQRYIEQFDRGELMLVPPKEHWLWAFLKLSYEGAPMVAALPRRLVHARGGVEFVTCDGPVVTARRIPGDLECVVGDGWKHPLCEAVFALSPTHALVVGPNVETDPVIGTAEWCTSVRDRTIRNADRFVFARSPDSRISEILASSKAPTSVMEFDGEQHETGQPVGKVAKRMFEAGDRAIVRWGPPR